MAWYHVVFGILGFIAVILFSIIYANMKKVGKRIDVEPNMPLLRFLDTERTAFTDGYSSGIVKTQKPNKNGTILIEFYPDDVKQTMLSPRSDIQSFIVDKNSVLREEVGGLSARRTIIFILPRNLSYVPKCLQRTNIGKELDVQGTLSFIKSTFGESTKTGDEAIKKGMEYYARGDVPKATLEIQEKIITELRKLGSINPTEESQKPKG